MKGWYDYRDAPLDVKKKMKELKPEFVQTIELAERKTVDPVWVHEDDFPGLFSEMEPKDVRGAGWVFKSPKPAT